MSDDDVSELPITASNIHRSLGDDIVKVPCPSCQNYVAVDSFCYNCDLFIEIVVVGNPA